MAAISFGEVPNNLRPGNFRMGKPSCHWQESDVCQMRTQGSETSQYLEENKKSRRMAEHFLNSGERNGNSPNLLFIVGVVRQRRRIYTRGVTKCNVS